MTKITPVKFTKLSADSAPDNPGVYVLWTVTAIGRMRAVYVGVSKRSIRTRLCSHFKQSHNRDLNLRIRGSHAALLMCWRSTKYQRAAKRMETILIRHLRPEANISENSD